MKNAERVVVVYCSPMVWKRKPTMSTTPVSAPARSQPGVTGRRRATTHAAAAPIANRTPRNGTGPTSRTASLTTTNVVPKKKAAATSATWARVLSVKRRVNPCSGS